MIVFGCSITKPDVYRACAEPGIRSVLEPGAVVLPHAAAGSVARSYNLLIEEASAHEDLEALVLLHQDTEIVKHGFCANVRRALEDPEVAVVGAAGAVGARSIAWWEGSVTWDGVARCLPEIGAGGLPELSWNSAPLPAPVPFGPVDVLDGFVLVLSPWAVRTLRFDESLPLKDGYDFDICRQAGAAGKKVVAADLGVVHRHALEVVTDPQTWIEAHMAVAEKWDNGPGGTEEEEAAYWERRARLAEAEAGVARLAGASKLLLAYAGASVHKEGMAALTETPSWKLTRPLREANARRRQGRVKS